MQRNGLPLVSVVLTVASLLFVGCTTPAPSQVVRNELLTTLEAMQQMYGPPSAGYTLPQDYMSDPFMFDLNGDGREETIVVFGDEGIEKPTFSSPNIREWSVVTRGFMVLTEIGGRQWPLFYYYTEWRASFHLSRTADRTGIVKEGGKDGEQVFWGWHKGDGDFPARWESLHRTWDKAERHYGPWQMFPPVFADYGK